MTKPNEGEKKYVLMIGFLGEDHPLPLVYDDEIWPDAHEVRHNDEV